MGRWEGREVRSQIAQGCVDGFTSHQKHLATLSRKMTRFAFHHRHLGFNIENPKGGESAYRISAWKARAAVGSGEVDLGKR